ncbi:MAG TPA: 23S rRNA (adenine(2030)-N(6))-methyltransferase RlmJ [Xanthobacteraceae bacterium]|nr:23S rRNA (adenine(2030)-N(6))-methyltransferase RlmJ [Xanthobacteraceae bacterium]
MNYRHGFHAGNFADVHKHVTLSRILVHLGGKPAPFRVLDTHAGAGLYDLCSEEAGRTGEWRLGIGRLSAHAFAAEVAALLAPYLQAVAKVNPAQALGRYPGSPLVCRALMRPSDRLVACELHPAEAAELVKRLGRGRHAKAIAIDGWTALNAYVPPPERRGLVLIDPPYEESDEFERLAAALIRVRRKWPTGIYLAWYPIKDRAGPDGLAEKLSAAQIPKILRSELSVGRSREGRLEASGLLVVNPPWRLEAELSLLVPALVAAMQQGDGACARLDWLGRAG